MNEIIANLRQSLREAKGDPGNLKGRSLITAVVRRIAREHFQQVRNLPKDDVARKNNKRAMEGLKLLKQDKVGVENVYSSLRRIFDHHLGQGEQQRRQAYESFKAEFEAKVQQALQQQLGGTPVGFKMNVERQPQFQEEWRRVLAGLDSQYNTLLSEHKRELSELK